MQNLLVEAVRGIMLWTMLQVMPAASSVLRLGQAARVEGVVEGREEAEDVATTLDIRANNLYLAAVETIGLRLGIPVALYSEHGVQDPHIEGQWYLVVDPIGGTTYARLGLMEGVWSVWSIFDPTRTPVLGGSVDVRHREIQLTFPEGVRLISFDWSTLEFGHGEVLPKPSKEAVDSDTVLSAYLGDPAFGDPAARLMREIAESARPLDPNISPGPRPFMWHAGGESTGPGIASGRIHGYVSVCEPNTEIVVWLGIQQTSGFFVGVVQEDKSIAPYEGFVPENFVRGRVPLFIVTATEQLAYEWVRRMPQEAIEHAYAHYRARYAH